MLPPERPIIQNSGDFPNRTCSGPHVVRGRQQTRPVNRRNGRIGTRKHEVWPQPRELSAPPRDISFPTGETAGRARTRGMWRTRAKACGRRCCQDNGRLKFGLGGCGSPRIVFQRPLRAHSLPKSGVTISGVTERTGDPRNPLGSRVTIKSQPPRRAAAAVTASSKSEQDNCSAS